MTLETTNSLAVFDRIVCGIDGTPESLEAARQAERLGTPGGLLRLAAVTEVNTAVHAGFAMSHVLEELDAAAREGLEKAIAEVHPASAELLAGDPVPALLDEIRRMKATLVAVGPRGHSRAAGMIVGGVATELLHNAPCSVLFAREPRFGEFPLSVMTGVDGSPESLAALAVAEELAARFHSEHLVVTATGGKGVELEAIRALVPDVIPDPGRPAEALSDLSQEVDLLVVGSRGLHGLKAIGSVSERVAHRAACSVLIVRNLGGDHEHDH